MGSRVYRLSVLIAVTAAWAGFAESAQSKDSRVCLPCSHEKHPIFDISSVGTVAPDSLLGIEVVADDVRVSEVTEDGFWVTPRQGEERTFIVAAEGSLIQVRVGELIRVHGEVRLTSNLADRHVADRQAIENRTSFNVVPYVYAYTVRPAWPNGAVVREDAKVIVRPVVH